MGLLYNMGNDSDDFFKNLVGHAFRTYRKIEKQKKAERERRPISTGSEFSIVKADPELSRILSYCILAIIAFVGVEPVKVIFRKNFGLGGVNLLRLITCCLFFMLIGLIAFGVGIACLFGAFDDKKDDYFLYDGATSFIVTGFFYVALAIYSFKKGWHHAQVAANNNLPVNHNGDIHLLHFLVKEGWSTTSIKWLAEPLITIFIGICFLLFVNIAGGIPIIICGLSLWAYSLMEMLLFGNQLEQRTTDLNDHLKHEEKFNNVETDFK